MPDEANDKAKERVEEIERFFDAIGLDSDTDPSIWSPGTPQQSLQNIDLNPGYKLGLSNRSVPTSDAG